VVLYFLAIDLMPVGPATLLNNTSPVFAAVFAALFLREPLSPRVGIALTLAMVGAAVVVLGMAPGGQRLHLGLGAVAGLLSGVVSGAAYATLRALRLGTDSVTVLLSFCLIGALVSLPLASVDLQPLSPGLWLSTVGVGVLSIAGQFLLTYGLAYVPTASGTATSLLTTIFSWTLGAVFLHEGVNLVSAMGAMLCIVGVVLASRAVPAGGLDRPGEGGS
jgi:drug/metabolite transporter (DMT)-like permease